MNPKFGYNLSSKWIDVNVSFGLLPTLLSYGRILYLHMWRYAWYDSYHWIREMDGWRLGHPKLLWFCILGYDVWPNLDGIKSASISQVLRNWMPFLFTENCIFVLCFYVSFSTFRNWSASGQHVKPLTAKHFLTGHLSFKHGIWKWDLYM